MVHVMLPTVHVMLPAVHVMLPPMLTVLYFYISTSLSLIAVPNMAVFCSSFIFVLSQYGAQLFPK
jgi:hypothetical protein